MSCHLKDGLYKRMHNSSECGKLIDVYPYFFGFVLILIFFQFYIDFRLISCVDFFFFFEGMLSID